MAQVLLTAFFKIYSKILVYRLAYVTHTLIQADQEGLVKGQQAPDGTRHMFNLIKVIESHGLPSVSFMFYAKKGFDRVHLGPLRAILHKFGFN